MVTTLITFFTILFILIAGTDLIIATINPDDLTTMGVNRDND